ncbi:TPA: hypothetical protein ACH3X2_002298 [Trebouxia sp. C0005]
MVNWKDRKTTGLRQLDDWCAAALAQSRICSMAETNTPWTTGDANSCGSGIQHIIVAMPPQQPNHWPASSLAAEEKTATLMWCTPEPQEFASLVVQGVFVSAVEQILEVMMKAQL